MSKECAPLPECIERLTSLRAVQGEQGQKIDKIINLLDGNGTAGLKVRIDRLEQSEKSRSRLVWAVVSCFIVLSVATIVGWIKAKIKGG